MGWCIHIEGNCMKQLIQLLWLIKSHNNYIKLWLVEGFKYMACSFWYLTNRVSDIKWQKYMSGLASFIRRSIKHTVDKLHKRICWKQSVGQSLSLSLSLSLFLSLSHLIFLIRPVQVCVEVNSKTRYSLSASRSSYFLLLLLHHLTSSSAFSSSSYSRCPHEQNGHKERHEKSSRKVSRFSWRIWNSKIFLTQPCIQF
jgi:hypothetical protein